MDVCPRELKSGYPVPRGLSRYSLEPMATECSTSLCFVCFGLVVVLFFGCVLFVCLVSFVSGCALCLFGFLLGQLAGLRTGPLPVLL